VSYAIREGDMVDVLVAMLVVDIDSEFQSLLPNRSVALVAEDGAVTAQVCDGVGETGECIFAEPRPVGRAETDVSTGELLYMIPRESQRPRLVTQRIIQQATVLGVGTFPLREAPVAPIAEEGGEQQAAPTVVSPDVITLIVTPQEALALNFAIKSGMDITFTLRGPEELNQFQTDSVSLQYMFENYSIALPSKLPYGLQPRMDDIIEPVLPNDGVPPQ
jgi:pilus assembly protein CpaB